MRHQTRESGPAGAAARCTARWSCGKRARLAGEKIGVEGDDETHIECSTVRGRDV